MKQLHLLLGTALFFTAVGFWIGQKQGASLPLPKPSDATSPNRAGTKVTALTPKIADRNPDQAITVKPPKVNLASATPTPANNSQPVFSEQDYATDEKIKNLTSLLTSLKTDQERARVFNDIFEINPRTPEIDADSANTINDFFRDNSTLKNFIPQQISCHSSMCKVDLTNLEEPELNLLMEKLSEQLAEHTLNASHVLLARNAAQSNAALYVSLSQEGELEQR